MLNISIGGQSMRLVPIECIKSGVFLAKTMYDKQGRILLRQGVELTETIIQKLKVMGMLALYINDEYSDNIIEDIIKPELRQRAVNTVKETFFSLESYFTHAPDNNLTDKKRFVKEKQKRLKL